jgi:uncharacterized protein YukE
VLSTSTSENVQKEMHEAWEAFKEYVVDQKQKAIVHGKELLQKADARIEELEGKADKASGETKTQYQKEIKVLKKKFANAAQKLDELENASADGWKSAKEGFTQAYKDLYDAYKAAVEKF